MQFLRLGSAGMRGQVGSGLTPRLVMNFASAFGSYLDGGTVVVGRDSRTSSPMLHEAVCSALLGCGCMVVDAGICPAPVVQFSVPVLGADGGILVGAGHHPADWNAIVPLGANGAYLGTAQMQELLDIYHSAEFRRCGWDKVGKMKAIPADIPSQYLDRLCKIIDARAVSSRKFRIVADFCNGSGSGLASAFASRFGLEMISINDIFSGILPHDPEPRPRSSVQAQSMLKYLKADAGFVFNSDMSRTAVVTDRGETLSEEYTFPLVAEHLLSKAKTPMAVVTNPCTTRTLDDIVSKHAGILHKTKVGQAPVIDRMLDCGALMAGDGSGSVAIGGFLPAFDSFISVAAILECMAMRGMSSGSLADNLPRYHIVKKKVYCPSSHAYTLIRRMKEAYPDGIFSDDDGIRFDFDNGWIHLRAAMTEPVIRTIVEWRTKDEAEEKAAQVRGMIERLVAE